MARLRRFPDPPATLTDHVSRRDAAQLLGFASEFKVRQLEKQGRLHAVRGAMGQAWYPRSQVLAVRRVPGVSRSPVDGSVAANAVRRVSSGRLTDAALIAHLREPADAQGNPRTVVDLVADTGVSIARAERVYRFWLAHDRHPVARNLRIARSRNSAGAGGMAGDISVSQADSDRAPLAGDSVPAGEPAERRGGQRIERDTLIRQLRHADPEIRAQAFEKLKSRPGRG